MTTLKSFVDRFLQVSAAHIAVQTAVTGEQAYIAVGGNQNYPQVYLEQPFTIQTTVPVQTLTLRFYVFDLLRNPTEDQKVQTITETTQIADEILMWFKTNEKTTYKIGDSWNILSFTEFSTDGLTGVVVETEVQWPLPVNLCDVKEGLFDL